MAWFLGILFGSWTSGRLGTSMSAPAAAVSADLAPVAFQGIVGAEPLGRVTTYSYDLSGRLTSVTDYGLRPITSYIYDADGNFAGTEGAPEASKNS